MANIKSDLLDQVMKAYAHNEVRLDDNQQRYEDSWLYFMGKRPLNIEQPTQEQIDRGEDIPMEYVEPVVAQAVDKITPQVLDIFTENDETAVTFRDNSFKPNPIMAEIINAEVNYTILHRNDGYRLLENALKEGLITGDCFSKVFIDEKHENDVNEITDWISIEKVISDLSAKGWKTDLPEGIANGEKSGNEGGIEWRTTKPQAPQEGELAQPNIEVEIRGKLPIYKVDKSIIIENVGLRDLVIDTSCGEDFDKCRYICHKMRMTVGEAIDLGYKETALRSASTVTRLADAPYNKFNLVTNSQIGQTDDDWDSDYGDPLERMIDIYEHYIYSSIPNKGKKSSLYQVHTTDTELLDYHEITTMPFVHGQLDVIPESFWGRSLADIFARYQDLESKNMRLAYKNAFNATYNKVLVTKNQYDAESVINSNRPGAVIVQNSAGAIQPWPYVELPQSFAVVTQGVKQSRMDMLNGMSGNVNTEDGIGENVAAQTVSMILAQEQMKSKVRAKTFARTYVKPLSEKVFQILKENGVSITIPKGTKFKSVPTALPDDVSLTSSDFPEVWSFTIDINTNGDSAMEARQIAAVYQMVAQTNPSMITQDFTFKVADEQLRLVNREAIEFLPDPSTPNPAAQELQAAQKELGLINLQKAKAEVMKINSETALNEVKMGNEAQAHIVDQNIKMASSAADIAAKQRKADNDVTKTAIDQVATAAEIAHGEKDITVKHMIAHHQMYNGTPNP